ncbi:hypothetical protein O9992_26490 [Vibrio lentus]|nr:hypothetical protein [Vibrio lentus]
MKVVDWHCYVNMRPITNFEGRQTCIFGELLSFAEIAKDNIDNAARRHAQCFIKLIGLAVSTKSPYTRRALPASS